MKMTNPRVKNLTANNRLVLLSGFGGLLALMIFAEYNGSRALVLIRASNDSIREDYLLHTRVLDRIRSDLYVSGTYVRDYLLEPESGKAEEHRKHLMESRRDMESALLQYRRLLNPHDSPPFEVLAGALVDYWQTLEPVFVWTAAERQEHGYPFLRDEVFPRRTAMLGIADQIGTINESQLEAGKVRLDETFSQFHSRMMLAIALTIGIGALLAIFTSRRILTLEAETAARYNEISEARQELKQLSARLVDAQEEERRVISRELHDEIGQAMTGTLLEMANLSIQLRAGNLECSRVKAEQIKKEIENSIGMIRNMALLLRPSMLDDLGLIPALQWQARELSRRSGLRVRVAAEQVSEQLPEEYNTCIYRVVQEALHNAVRHADAGTVRIHVREEVDLILLSIQDDGKGFQPQEARGLGLLGMKERVNRLNGTLVVDSTPGNGTELRISLPVAALAGGKVGA